MLPNFLIIGAPRAGTTWISHNIRNHPEIFMPTQKELDFFNKHYDQGLDHYEAFFANANGELAIGEATPDYLHAEGVSDKIKNDLRDVKLIVSLRNPVDRLYSRYWNAKSKYAENKNLSFEEKIKSKPEFIEEGLYYRHLMRYLEFVPKENLLILLYDDLKKDENEFLRRIYEFLGVDVNYVSPKQEFKINASASKPNLGKSQFLYYLYKSLRKVGLYQLGYKVEQMNRKELPKMSPKTKEWLVNSVYGEENEKLGELIGRDLSKWNSI